MNNFVPILQDKCVYTLATRPLTTARDKILLFNFNTLETITPNNAVDVTHLDKEAGRDNNLHTTHPLQRHSVGSCLGRKNRLLGGFFMSGKGHVH